MKLRTQFIIMMVLFGLTLSVIAGSVFVTSRDVVRLDRQEEAAAAVGRGASELGYLAGDYVLHREEQQQARWEAKWTSVTEAASVLEPVSSEERAIVRSLGSDLARLKEVFDDVADAGSDASQTLLPVSWSRMSVQNEALAFDSMRLAQVLRNSKADIQQRNALLIVTLVALFGAYFVADYFLVYRRALGSLSEVQAGTEVIGRGDLDHTIAMDRRDEIGDLARSFNKMSADLKGVMASKTQLETEVAHRKVAEEALQASLAQIEEISEARLQELSTTKQLLEAADRVARWTDVEDLAGGLARLLLKLTSHSRATIDAWDQERREIKVMASEGEMPYAVGSRWSIDVVSVAARKAIGEHTPGVWDMEALSQEDRGIAATDYALRYGLYVPLVQRDNVVGMIVLDDPGEKREFSEREIQLVGAIAAQAAVGFENARLFGEQRGIADRLQAALLVLPDELPGIEFAHEYRSATIATRVGGDFYDLFELDHDTVGVVIGDVAGKGLDAAVLTSMVKNTIRAHANEGGKTPSAILHLTNQVVYKATPTESFVTVFFAMLDCRSGRLSYANAGHTTAAIVHPEGTVERLPSTGPLLGAFADTTFGEAEARIGVDDVLMLYTDGLIEARLNGDLYGEERLFSILGTARDKGASALLNTVMADVMDYSGGHLRDDLAILSVKRAG